MNKLQTSIPQRNDLTLLHEKLISLLSDSKSFEQFSLSPVKYANQFGGLPKQYRDLLSSINLGGLSTFRRIVRGTREVRLRQVFSNLSEKIGSDETWLNLMDEFLDSVVITNGRNDEDLTLFAEFVRAHESSILGDLAILERSIYSVSNGYVDFANFDLEHDVGNGVNLSPWVEVVVTSHSAQILLSPELTRMSEMPSDRLFTLIYRSSSDSDIRLRPITSELGKLLSESRYLPGEILVANERLLSEVRRLWPESCFQNHRGDGDKT